MYFTIVLIIAIDPNSKSRQFWILTFPQLIVAALQLKVVTFVNFWNTRTQNGGYSLMAENSFIWPTTSTNVIERENPSKWLKLICIKWNDLIWKLDIFGLKAWFGGGRFRLANFPQVYSFDGGPSSRRLYRKRFCLALGELNKKEF